MRSSSSLCTQQCSHNRAASKDAPSPRQVERKRTRRPSSTSLLGSLLPAAMVGAGMEGERGIRRGLHHLLGQYLCSRRLTTTRMVTILGTSDLETMTITLCRRSRMFTLPDECRSSHSLRSILILDQGVRYGNVEARMGSAPVEGSPRLHPCRRCRATLLRRGPRIRWSLLFLRSQRVRSTHSLSVTLRTRTSATRPSARSACSTRPLRARRACLRGPSTRVLAVVLDPVDRAVDSLHGDYRLSLTSPFRLSLCLRSLGTVRTQSAPTRPLEVTLLLLILLLLLSSRCAICWICERLH